MSISAKNIGVLGEAGRSKLSSDANVNVRTYPRLLCNLGNIKTCTDEQQRRRAARAHTHRRVEMLEDCLPSTGVAKPPFNTHAAALETAVVQALKRRAALRRAL